jgi:uncharacterized metal-binding protein
VGKRIRFQADGPAHERINRVLFLVIVLPLTGLLLYLHQFLMAVSLSLGAAYGIWLVTPDVDLETFTHGESRWFDGPLWLRPIGYLVFACYYPLALVLRHRGISHAPVFGALVVYVYTWLLPALVLLATGWRPLWLLHTDLHVGLFTGLVIAHLFHIAEDRLLR